MFHVPAVTLTLTAVLLLSGSYYLLQATRSHHLTDRVNKSLHALMNVLMAAMLWNLVPSTTLAQIAILTGAALWFLIQSVARPEFKLLCGGSQGRVQCLYHGVTMAGAALMVAMMGHPTAGDKTVPAGALSTPHAHHTMPAASQNTAAATFDLSSTLAIVLTVVFGAAAVAFLIRLLLSKSALTNSTLPHASAPKPALRTGHLLEALGAAVMALMFTTMA
ncbi:hypothetical protein ACVWY0_004445 [Arthrobacter sp. UYNi723]